jgi:hypothetical protein
MKQLMMMVLMMYSTIVSFGQDSLFTLNQNGLTDYVITNCDGKTHNELYKKTLDWVLVTYNTPSSVIKAQIENNYIRIEGSAKYLVRTGGFGDALKDTNKAAFTAFGDIGKSIGLGSIGGAVDKILGDIAKKVKILHFEYSINNNSSNSFQIPES